MNEEKIIYLYECNLPEPLSKKETYDLISKIKQENENALEKLVMHNLKLVIHEVLKRFAKFNCDKEELVAIGNIGLLKAIKTFDITKNIEFTTYATRCIDNEILMFLRKEKKIIKYKSLDDVCYNGNDELRLKDTIADNKDYFEKKLNQITVRGLLNELNSKDKEIIMLYFGFYNKKYGQREIAKMMNLSQSCVSKTISNTLETLKKQLTTDNKIKTLNK